MAYYLDLFSPETYKAFSNSARNVSGFRERQEGMADKIKPGDKLLCYMTKLSRWFGVLEVASEHFRDDTPIFYPADDPFIIRFKVNPLVWLPKELSVPIHESKVWISYRSQGDLSRTAHSGPANSGTVSTRLPMKMVFSLRICSRVNSRVVTSILSMLKNTTGCLLTKHAGLTRWSL